jgi:hypothetical protein
MYDERYTDRDAQARVRYICGEERWSGTWLSRDTCTYYTAYLPDKAELLIVASACEGLSSCGFLWRI